LYEFNNVFIEEIPSGLLLIRRIEHQIDLVPKATIPNRLAYWSNHDETKELQKKMKKLMSKEAQMRKHESMCYFDLMPKKDGTLGMYVNCCAINNITIKYRHFILRRYFRWVA
jgi:hypothetical protein